MYRCLVCSELFGPPLGLLEHLIGTILARFPRISTVAQSCVKPYLLRFCALEGRGWWL